jgi:2-polyprenyl-3-methyl-5-hydroxy-6-metoxy-1,4-benzoquinol methylase
MRMERWEAEAEFFDHVAEQLRPELEPLDPLTVVRYSGNLKPRFNKEYRFHLLGDLRGKRVLDLGCGEGSNAVLLATLGAEVTGIDISPKSIELATARARLDGVAERVTFLCAPIETAVIPPDTFDVIWGDGVLHHLIDELDRVLAHLVNWAKPDALALFSSSTALASERKSATAASGVHASFMIPFSTFGVKMSLRMLSHAGGSVGGRVVAKGPTRSTMSKDSFAILLSDGLSAASTFPAIGMPRSPPRIRLASTSFVMKLMSIAASLGCLLAAVTLKYCDGLM